MIDQLGIALTGVIAIFLTQSKREELRRYACIFGLAGQPFWFWAAWQADQWGILTINVLYAAAWSKGVWMHWLKPKPMYPDLTAQHEQHLREAFARRRAEQGRADK
jgi:hypothetical protein